MAPIPRGSLTRTLRAAPFVSPVYLISSKDDILHSSFYNLPSEEQVKMNQVPTTPAGRNNGDRHQVVEILLQNWAVMVDEAREEARSAEQLLASVEARASRLFLDNTILHDTVNRSFEETAQYERLALRMSHLVLRLIRENPEIQRAEYRDEYLDAINAFNAENPIDLTANEVIDEEMGN